MSTNTPSMSSTTSAASTPSTTAANGHYAAVNGLNLYYETWGGEAEAAGNAPLVLLHGGIGSSEMFGEVLTLLAAGRQVIAVHLQGHGRTADIDRPLSFEAMADDIAALIHSLGLERADLMGYSLGGGTAVQAAIRHPEVVHKLVNVSTPFSRDGWYPEVLAGMDAMGPQAAEAMKPSPLYQHYARVAPRPEDWPVLIAKVGDLLRQDYDWSAEVARIKAQTMLVYADHDAVRPAHIVAFFALLGGGQRDAGWDGSGMSNARLAVLPGLTHYNVGSSPALAAAVIPFLDGASVG